MFSKANFLTKPVTLAHRALAHSPKTVLVLETRATEIVSCKVMSAIARPDDISQQFVIQTAVQYADGGAWYGKEKRVASSLRDALKICYQMSRRHYKVTSSRAFAGLLHDSVVPATEDIEN